MAVKQTSTLCFCPFSEPAAVEGRSERAGEAAAEPRAARPPERVSEGPPGASVIRL